MKRGYTAERYLARVAELRRLVPEIELASDFIVGFPGETEADHDATCRLMDEVGFAQSFVFKYSPRPGTDAAELADDVPDDVKRRRNQDLLERQERVSLAKNRALVGHIVEVLVEGPSKTRADRWTGRTAKHQIVHFPVDAASAGALAGRYLPVRVGEAGAYSLSGEVIGEAEADAALPAAAGGPAWSV
jgi:tRNA-2-methylthio-N6-dimethylallyladenosine synthase